MSPSTAVRRIATAAAVLTTLACHDSVPLPTAPTTPDASVSRGGPPQHAQDRLEVVFQRLSPEIMALPGTVFADNDEAVGRVVFGVEHEAAGRGVRQALQRLGIAEADYAIEVTQPIHQMTTLRDKFDPTRAGIQINFGQYVCTMGFNISSGTKDGIVYGPSFITNSHCTNTQGGNEGTLYYQPTSSTGVIATEADDPQYFKNGVCPKGKKCRYSDASRALYGAGTRSNLGEIARTIGVNTQSLVVDAGNPLFTITAQSTSDTPAPLGAVVNKVGRTTGWTQGTVTRTCVNTSVSGSQIMQLCQTFVNNPNATIVLGGDSGSGVFMGDGNVTLVGILWGGSSDNRTFIFSPLKQIQMELGTFSAVR